MPVNKPSIDELSQKVDSRYSLVVAASMRGRELVSGNAPMVESKDREGKERKPVSIAVEEINRGLLTYRRNAEDEEV